MFRTLQPVILASGSPRRKRLLHSVGVSFAVCPSRMDESEWPFESILPVNTPAEIAQGWARLKAESVSALNNDSWVLGADTIVVLDGRIFGKPADSADAAEMLRMLSDRTHEVITGMCLIEPGGKLCRTESVITRVRFKLLSMGEIKSYVNTGEPLDKAGAYGIQDTGAFLVKSVEGSYTNVVGLPLCETLEWLMKEKIIEPE